MVDGLSDNHVLFIKRKKDSAVKTEVDFEEKEKEKSKTTNVADLLKEVKNMRKNNDKGVGAKGER
jgi:hypothetical protein